MPTDENIGDVIRGTPFVRCIFRTHYVNDILVTDPSTPLEVASYDTRTNWTEKQTKPGGWTREIPHVLDPMSNDPSRAGALFIVIKRGHEPVSTGRDSGYGGGPWFLVKRLTPEGEWGADGEEIRYTRRCSYNTDISEAAEVVGHRADLEETILRHTTLSNLTAKQKAALGLNPGGK